MTDFRIKTSWRTHRKRKRLIRRLGHVAVIALQDLWSYCAESRTSGDLSGLSNDDIADECDWEGCPDELATTLAELKLLDGEPGAYRIHDWIEHNPWVAGAEQRSRKAKDAARARWQNGNASSEPGNAGGSSEQCPNTNTNTNTTPTSDTNTNTAAEPAAGVGESATPGEGVSWPELQALIKDKGWQKASRQWQGRGEVLAPFPHGSVARAMAEAAAEFQKGRSKKANGSLVIKILERLRDEGDPDPPPRHPASTPATEVNGDEEPTWDMPDGGVMGLLKNMADGMDLPQ